MSTIENMIENEMVQDVMETVVEVQPNASMLKTIAKHGAVAAGCVIIWEGGKFVFKKVKKHIEAKKNADGVTEADFEDQDVANVEVK